MRFFSDSFSASVLLLRARSGQNRAALMHLAFAEYDVHLSLCPFNSMT
jgi:hypothetical protein